MIREEHNLNALRSKEIFKTEAIDFSVQTATTPQAAAVTSQCFRDRSALSCTHCHRQIKDIMSLNVFCYMVILIGGTNRVLLSVMVIPIQETLLVMDCHLLATTIVGVVVLLFLATVVVAVPTLQVLLHCILGTMIAQLISLLQAQRPNTSFERLSSKTNLTDVIIDTRASHHITGDPFLLTGIVNMVPSTVTFPDGSATQCGTLVLNEYCALHVVLFMPNFSCTLISVAKLLKHTGCITVYTYTFCFLQDHFKGL